MTWKQPGGVGRIVYALAAAIVTALVTIVSRLQVAKHRGRRRAARGLPDGPIIVISNHTSYADGFLLALVCRHHGRSVRLLATAGVFRAPGLGWLVRRLGFIPVARGTSEAASALDAAATALAAGEAVALFPEGRTTRDLGRWPERGKTGAIRLALQTGAPIVPVAMVGAHRIVDRNRPIRSLMTSVVIRPRVFAEVGSPIDVRALTPTSSPDADEVRRLTDAVMDELVRIVERLRGEERPAAA